MQTYLPYPHLDDSVRTYNRPTLMSVQRSILSILEVLHEVQRAPHVSGHPEIARWKGHEPFLCEYGFVVDEAVKRGPTFPMMERSMVYSDRIAWHLECASAGEFTLAPPGWWGNTDFHIAEQSALLRDNPDHYSKFFEGVPFDIPPTWVTRLG